MRLTLLAFLGLMLALAPAMAARTPERSQQVAAPRGKPAAAAPSTSTRSARPAPRPAATSGTRATKPASLAGTAARPATRPTATRTAARATPRGTDARLVRTAGRPTAASRGASATTAATATCRAGSRQCARLVRVSAPPMRWSQGLAPAANVQAATCPAGTMATLATGHAAIVRCMPI
jgi:hypothetical protein